MKSQDFPWTSMGCGLIFLNVLLLTAAASGQLAVTPSTVNFGSIPIGSSVSQSVVLNNSGRWPLTVFQATESGTGFSMSGLTTPLTLAPSQSATFTETFTPQSGGSVTGSLLLAYSLRYYIAREGHHSTTATVALIGTGITSGQLTPNPSSVNFGNVQVATSQSQTVTLTNSGGASLTISAAAASGSGFSLGGLTLPLTLNAGQSTSFTAIFSPTAPGAASGSVSVTSTGSDSNLTIPLSGTGVAQGALTANPTSLAYGNVQDGTSKSLSETLTNTGGSSLTISAASTSLSVFTLTGLSLPVTLTAGQSVSFTVLFSPTVSGAINGSASITSTGSDSNLTIPLSGTGVTQGTLAANPASLAFGNVQIGNNLSLSEILTNSGGMSLTISAATASGAGFSLSGLSLPLTLTAGQSSSFTVLFAPTATGAVSGSLSITSTGSDSSLTVPLAGTGVAQGALTPTPTSLAFGSVQVGNKASLPQTLTNSGGTSLTISAATASGTGFSLSGLSLPLTLTAGQSTSFTVLFAPAASGAVSGSLSITSTGSDSTLTVPLSGTGVAQGALTPNPTSLAFGNVPDGSSSSLPETLTNSGGTSLTISGATASGTGFSLSGLTLPVTLSAGQSTSFTVIFAPTTSGAASGNLSITSNGGNPSLSIPLSGTGVAPGTLAANPTSLAFGNVQVGKFTNLSETLTNTGGSSVTISQANVTGAVFSTSGLNLPLTLTSGQSVTFTATFSPTSAGAVSGTLSVISNASNSTLNVALSGTGTAPGTLAVSPTTLSFGNVAVGSSAALNGSVTASGASVTVTSASISNGEFGLSGISLPATLGAGQSAAFTVTFTPQASGATSGTLSLVSNASNSPATETLTGTGTAATQHTVDLTWNSSSGAVGYNVYRGMANGGPYTMINSSLDGSTSYIDNTVVAGQTYYYVATAVNSEAQESGYSNVAQAVIPNP